RAVKVSAIRMSREVDGSLCGMAADDVTMKDFRKPTGLLSERCSGKVDVPSNGEGGLMTGTTRAITLGVIAILIGLPIMSWATFLLHVVPDGHADFRANYTAGYMVRTGQPLYNYELEMDVQGRKVSPETVAAPFIHSAYEALVYVPVSFFSYLQAYWLWFAVNLIVLIYVYRLLRPQLTPLSAVASWVPAATFAAFMPVGAALVQGQDSLLLLLLLAVTFALLAYSEHL